MRKILSIAYVSALVLPIAGVSLFAQTEQPAASGGSGGAGSSASVVGPGSQVLLSEIPTAGDVAFNESDVSIIVNGGTHTVDGSMQINGNGDSVVVEFDEEKGNGYVKVNGALILGPDNAPILGVDLSKVNLSRGAKFVLVDAAEIVGEFNGLSNGSTFTVGEYTFRIVYTATSITLVVVDVPRRIIPFVTPIVEISADLIDPTSTEPTMW